MLIKYDSREKLVCVYGNLKKIIFSRKCIFSSIYRHIYIYTHNIYLYLESVWKLEVDQTVIPKRERRDYSSWSRKQLLKIIGNPFRSGISPLGGLTDRGGFNGFGKKKGRKKKKKKAIPFINPFNGWNKKKFENQNYLFFFIIETFLSLIHRYCIKYSIINVKIFLLSFFFAVWSLKRWEKVGIKCLFFLLHFETFRYFVYKICIIYDM